MDDTTILLSNFVNDEEKIQSANSIIVTYDFPLSTEQILFAHRRLLDNTHNVNHREFACARFNYIDLLNKILNDNTGIYIALILALCDNLNINHLSRMMFLENYGGGKSKVNFGANYYFDNGYKIFFELFKYYNFDENNISNISQIEKNLIKEYRQNNYTGKLTKGAIKN